VVCEGATARVTAGFAVPAGFGFHACFVLKKIIKVVMSG
jgi:hypothetical protein